MTHQIDFLSRYSLSDIYPVFMAAFADYVQDASHVTEYNFVNRAIKNGVDLDFSIGAFVNGEMVGFTLVGLDHFDGKKAAFDAGTGIIKTYRGRGIAREMFDYAIPEMRKVGVERFILEVLKDNTPAIKAYRKAGFTVTRELDSYALSLEKITGQKQRKECIEIHEINKEDLHLYEGCLDWQPSWENSISSIERIPNEVLLFGASCDGKRVGVLVYYPMLNWILCLAVRQEFRRQYVASQMLNYLKSALHGQVKTSRLINVLHTDEGMKQFLEKVGFEYAFGQYEMGIKLT